MTISLYIHLPWCEKKCPYCDFNSYRAPRAIPQARYVEALLADLAADLKRYHNLQPKPALIDSVFIGGGTPSLFDPDSIAHLLDGVRSLVELTPDCEITLEANPSSVEAERLRPYQQSGVNRVSLGVQSLNDRFLQALGRVHTASDALKAIDVAYQSGIERINLDLMYALPNQSASEALADLKVIESFPVNHLSWYELTIEPNTGFAHKRPTGLPTPNQSLDIREAGQAYLAERGLMPYEVSAYARQNDQRCRHNLNYWRYGDYLGIGAGAHEKLTDTTGNTLRSQKFRSPLHYIDRCLNSARRPSHPKPNNPAIAFQEIVEGPRLRDEYLLNTLRMSDGLPLENWRRVTGTKLDGLHAAAEELIAAGHLIWDANHLKVSSHQILDEVIVQLSARLDHHNTSHRPTARQPSMPQTPMSHSSLNRMESSPHKAPITNAPPTPKSI